MNKQMNRITLDEAAQKMEALAKELEEHGFQYFIWVGDFLEGKAKTTVRETKEALQVFMSVAMELAARGVPVPLLMTAISYGEQVYNDQQAGRTPTDPETTATEEWADVIEGGISEN